MEQATPFTTCANGCGVPAKWKIKKNGRTKNLCNACATRSHDMTRHVVSATRTNAENKRKAEVLCRLGYNRRFST